MKDNKHSLLCWVPNYIFEKKSDSFSRRKSSLELFLSHLVRTNFVCRKEKRSFSLQDGKSPKDLSFVLPFEKERSSFDFFSKGSPLGDSSKAKLYLT